MPREHVHIITEEEKIVNPDWFRYSIMACVGIGSMFWVWVLYLIYV